MLLCVCSLIFVGKSERKGIILHSFQKTVVDFLKREDNKFKNIFQTTHNLQNVIISDMEKFTGL